MAIMPFTIYLRELRNKLQAPEAQEATHYGTLAVLLETWGDEVTAIVQPQRVINCGAPDIAIKRGPAPLGYVECKNVGANLDDIEQSGQLKRYRNSLPNLILTDYLEFRWYVEGELRGEARLGRLDRDGKVRSTTDGIAQVQELLKCFLRQQPPIAASASELARYMAGAARMIHDMTLQTLQEEDKSGSLPGMLQAFRDTLIPDLEPDQFADMYAQTIAYGLFSARYNVPAGTEFTREHAAFDLPKTNPFLRDLFNQIAGVDLDQSIVWIVDDLADLLNRAQMDQIADDFARRPGREDPVVHFYEDFLREYDPKEKKLRGVFYTPDPVVKYIVRSIDYLLKEKFDKPLGLADEEVYILDPACGTGTFLYFVIDQIYHNVCDHLGQGAWESYVQERLLGRVFGFELLMAPYTIAHMKLSIQLRDLGYNFRGDERLGIYLTNSLEEAIELAEGQLRLGIERTIAEESEAAGDIKLTKPIMVVLGNPPYSVSSANQGTHIEQLMDRYKEAVRREERNIQPLSDDYIKFIRFAHDRIEHTGYGIVGMITNHAYLSGLIHRGMRQELMETFPEVYVLDLHGNSRIGETTPEGGKDENVFDIQQGVAISVMVRPDSALLPQPQVRHADLWGLREGKYEALAESDVTQTAWEDLQPTEPYYFFIPRDVRLQTEYEQGWSVADIFPVHSSGIKTHRDKFVIDFDQDELHQRIAVFRDTNLSDDQIRDRFGLRDTGTWELAEARQTLQGEENWENGFEKVLYRPFDVRHIYYSDALIDRSRREVMQHMLHDNLALVTTRQWAAHRRFVVLSTRWLTEISSQAYAPYNIFPLYLYPEEGTTEEGRRANLNPKFVKEFAQKLGLTFIPDAGGDLTNTFGPEDVFYYAYAVFHSPTYRQRYAEFLKIDFPRLPLTADKELFARLVEKGQRLADLHLLRQAGNIGERPKFNPPNSDEVQRVRYDDENQRVYINKKQYFSGIEPEVWEFHIGGYQVCQKWLKDRKGRQLSYDDITHYQKIVLALRETISLMEEIDQIIPGWPVE